MASGDLVFNEHERELVERARRNAEADTDLTFSVFVGPLGDDSRQASLAMHRALPGQADAVLVAVDPGARCVEVVTGSTSRRWLDDRSCGLAVLSMTTSFSAGELAGGLANGLRTLAEHARHPRVLHLDEP